MNLTASKNYPSKDCVVKYRKLPLSVSYDQLCIYFSRLSMPVIFGGNSGNVEENRFSYFMAEPREVFEFANNEADFETKLLSNLGKYKIKAGGSISLPKGMFVGGWSGYFSYDLKNCFEKLPQSAVNDIDMPLVRLGFYDKVVCCDNKKRVCYLTAVEICGDEEKGDAKLDWLEEQLKKADSAELVEFESGEMDAAGEVRIESNMTRQDYLDKLARTHQYIKDGDVYQINLSQRFEVGFKSDPVELYIWQNRHNPSPYAAYLSWDDCAVVCASPELFLSVVGDTVKTSPIKGTRARVEGDNEQNHRNLLDLLNCEKERAELNMITDLERNDLSRICEVGSRFLRESRHIKAFPTVYHAISTIQGRLRSEISFYDVLRSTFPGGSITGAPKIRAMEVIDELEPTSRGIYTGSVGFIGIDGSVCLNIVIRTVIIRHEKAYVQTGGGIVADSVPEKEWEETHTKAKALVAGIEILNRANCCQEHG